jgi:hypothetical protein
MLRKLDRKPTLTDLSKTSHFCFPSGNAGGGGGKTLFSDYPFLKHALNAFKHYLNFQERRVQNPRRVINPFLSIFLSIINPILNLYLTTVKFYRSHIFYSLLNKLTKKQKEKNGYRLQVTLTLTFYLKGVLYEQGFQECARSGGNGSFNGSVNRMRRCA